MKACIVPSSCITATQKKAGTTYCPPGYRLEASFYITNSTPPAELMRQAEHSIMVTTQRALRQQLGRLREALRFQAAYGMEGIERLE